MNPDIHGLWPALLIPVKDNSELDTPRAIAHARPCGELGRTHETGVFVRTPGHQPQQVLGAQRGHHQRLRYSRCH